MCLAVAGPVLSIEGEGATRIGLVDLGGDHREISLALVGTIEVGTWVTVHAGHAIGTLTEAEAARLVELSEEIGALLEPSTGE
jgi:hydrogenase expression/formation protein HypC